MNIENLSLIEQTILTNKKKEIYQELRELARVIRTKQSDIQLKLRVGILPNEEENVVKDFLTHVITKNEIPEDIVLPTEIEQYLLTKGIEELLQSDTSM
ncbi:hypothetical protein BK784_34640 [Bacillus thuringiensis serovar medellin]|uniref:Uncharacterized protein n=1 Tax=Bacillus thuringiensis subsp. medellin TaxID=79672 RepID=A0A9X6R8R1_BACTV|nr:hypothetical protein [Bacillus thuringiensis]OUB84845.1 hypothetical protein BK784_34640 [Bacillus thuringiensis serovar medellin]